MVTRYCRTSGAVRVKRSTSRRSAVVPRYAALSLKFVVSTTSVSPSQRPTGIAHPLPDRGRKVRPSVERDDARLVDHLRDDDDVLPASGRSDSCRCIPAAASPLGTPRTMHRTHKLKSSGLSAGPRALRAAASPLSRVCASAVDGGILPSGGSITRDVRRVGTTFVPRSNQNSLYAPATSASALPPRRSRLAVSSVRRSKSAASCAVRNSLPARSAGRSNGVIVAVDQMPCRSGMSPRRARRLGERAARLREARHHERQQNALFHRVHLSVSRGPFYAP